MTTRVLAGAAAGWLGLYLFAYVRVVHLQGGDVARWYLALGILALASCVAAAAGVVPSVTAVIALVLTAVATLAGLLSIGLLLLPVIVALTIAVLRRRAVPDRQLV